MKKIICKREYNTDTATLIKKYTYSYYGDPAGFEEILYQTPDGLYFLDRESLTICMETAFTVSIFLDIMVYNKYTLTIT